MGINYVPKRDDGSNVIRDKDGIVIEVLPEYMGSHFSFTFRDGQAIGKKICGKRIEYKHFIGMQKQALAIYWQSINKRFDDAPLHKRVWAKDERNRLDLLLNYKCIVYPDGHLEIERHHNGKVVDMPYEDIDAAIRAQYHIIENYRIELGNNPEKLKEINRKIDYTNERRVQLVLEKNTMEKCIINSISIMDIMLSSSEKFFKGHGFKLRLNEVKNNLRSVWLHPYYKQAKRCLSFLDSEEIMENPRKVIRMGINSLEMREIDNKQLIKSLAEVSKHKNGAKIYKAVDSLLPKKCLMRYNGTIHIHSLLAVAEKFENVADVRLAQICQTCGRKRHCPQA